MVKQAPGDTGYTGEMVVPHHHILVCANVVILNEVWMSTDSKGEAMLCTSHTCHHDFRKICISVDLVLLPMLNAVWLASSVAD